MLLFLNEKHNYNMFYMKLNFPEIG